MGLDVDITMRGSRQRMATATGQVGHRPLRIRNGYGPSIGAISGDIGPDRVRLRFRGDAMVGQLSGSVAGSVVDVSLRSGYVVGTVGRQALQMLWSPASGQPRAVSVPAGNPEVALEVSHDHRSRGVAGTVEREFDAVVAVALLMQSPSPTVWRRLLAFVPKPRLGTAPTGA